MPHACKPCEMGIHSCCRLRIPLASGEGWAACPCQAAMCEARRDADTHAVRRGW